MNPPRKEEQRDLRKEIWTEPPKCTSKHLSSNLGSHEMLRVNQQESKREREREREGEKEREKEREKEGEGGRKPSERSFGVFFFEYTDSFKRE
jgi:hypothetical protein